PRLTMATSRILAYSPDAATGFGPAECWRYAARGSPGGLAWCRPSERACARGRSARTDGSIHHVHHVDPLSDLVGTFRALGAVTRHVDALLTDADRSNRDHSRAAADDVRTPELGPVLPGRLSRFDDGDGRRDRALGPTRRRLTEDGRGAFGPGRHSRTHVAHLDHHERLEAPPQNGPHLRSPARGAARLRRRATGAGLPRRQPLRRCGPRGREPGSLPAPHDSAAARGRDLQ